MESRDSLWASHSVIMSERLLLLLCVIACLHNACFCVGKSRGCQEILGVLNISNISNVFAIRDVGLSV
jgi:hypothetical protein